MAMLTRLMPASLGGGGQRLGCDSWGRTEAEGALCWLCLRNKWQGLNGEEELFPARMGILIKLAPGCTTQEWALGCPQGATTAAGHGGLRDTAP